jgi:hypothetical protein
LKVVPQPLHREDGACTYWGERAVHRRVQECRPKV